MNLRVVNEEVLYTTDSITTVSKDDISMLKQRAAQNRRKRVRLCTHKDINDSLHEMLIVHAKGAYVRPHKHVGKTESFHIIEGSLDVIILDEDGGICRCISMGPFSGDQTFYYRLPNDAYHTVVPRSEFVIFHEITNGPFRMEETVFPPWAPAEEDLIGQRDYHASLDSRLASLS